MMWRRYRGTAAGWWAVGLVVLGILAIAAAWRGAAATLFVPTQVAFGISGGLGGLLLVSLGLALLRSLARQIAQAEHAHRREQLLDAIDRVNELLRTTPPAP